MAEAKIIKRGSPRAVAPKMKPLYVELAIADLERYQAKADELGVTMRDFVRMALEAAMPMQSDFTSEQWREVRERLGSLNIPELPSLYPGSLPAIIAQSERISRLEAEVAALRKLMNERAHSTEQKDLWTDLNEQAEELLGGKKKK
jgi:hypothetical protein